MGAGLIGFLVVLGLVVAAILLFRSMSRHLRKVPASFDDLQSRGADRPSDDDRGT